MKARRLFWVVLLGLVLSGLTLASGTAAFSYPFTDQPCAGWLTRLCRFIAETPEPFLATTAPSRLPSQQANGVLGIAPSALASDLHRIHLSARASRLPISMYFETRHGVRRPFYREEGVSLRVTGAFEDDDGIVRLSPVDRERWRWHLEHRWAGAAPVYDGIYNWALRLDGSLQIGRKYGERGVETPHPCLVGGAADQIQVLAAGEVSFVKGRITYWNLLSGHFLPTLEYFSIALEAWSRVPARVFVAGSAFDAFARFGVGFATPVSPASGR